MAKKRSSIGNTPLERLALFKARPVNRDTLKAVDYKPAKGKSKVKRGPEPALPKSPSAGPKVSVFKAAAEAERKGRIRRVFGFKMPRGA